jgi:phospholipid/cholesterol/gamma-HCH transport system substrate-binding protein
METNKPKFKVRLGLFIIGGTFIFLAALFIIGKQKNLFDPVFKLTANFYNVSGLEVGSKIRFSGINVGTVDNIRIINDSTVQVDMLIKKSVQQFIKEDCQAAIGSAGIIGDKILVISQGSEAASMARNGQHIESKEPIETDAIMASLKVTAENAEVITDQLAGIMTKVNSGHGTLGRIINDETIAQDLSESTVNLKTSSKQIAEILTDINNGQGTLGKILQDPTIADDISTTMVNLKNSSKGLDELLEAAQHNFLFRGFFNKKDKETDENTKPEDTGSSTKTVPVQKQNDSQITESLQLIASESPVEMDSIMAGLQVTAANSKIISKELAEIMVQINSGKGTLGMLVKDTILAKVINQTFLNIKSGSKGLDENMNAAKENFLLKGYYERKQKAAEQKKADALEKSE